MSTLRVRPRRRFHLLLLCIGLLCASARWEPTRAQRPDAALVAFVGARIIDGSGAAAIENGVLLVRDGRIDAIGSAGTTSVGEGTRRVDVHGKTIIPGIINTHGHVNDVRGLKASPEFYTPEHVMTQLGVYARYGVTTVFSLGGDGRAGIEVRASQRSRLDRARLFVAGPVVSAADPDAARRAVDQLHAMRVDLVKIRVDDNLGTAPKMPAAAYRAVIDQAHRHGLAVAAHVFYLQDAKDIIAAGGDFIAHSVRDLPVDPAFIEQLKARDVCVCPTLMREVSTFVYESRPRFFDDPFFTREADASTMAALEAPEYQASIRADAPAQRYKKALEVAKANLKRLADEGVRVAFGTDTGPPGRFQGYFEHLELEQMVDAGLTPLQAIVAATGDAARCMKMADRIGTLKPGLEADFLVLARDPLADIRNTRTLESVWIKGEQIKSQKDSLR
jgi:imidazolonepropionase-like amidohydrolase